jgi:hypothetical protein
VQDWQNKCTKMQVNVDVVEEWSRIAVAMNELGKQGGGKGQSEDTAKEMMELLEAELKTVHDVMGKKWRCDHSNH